MLKLSLALLLAVGLAGSAVARPVLNPKARVMPPKEFDKPYTGNLVVTRVKSYEEVYASCPDVAYKGMTACMTSKDGVCKITMVSDSVLEELGIPPYLVLRHELGHCNGWPKDHPNARTIEEAVASELLIPGVSKPDWTAAR